MKKLLIALTLVTSQTAIADRVVQTTNGATCFINDNGIVYGCHGGYQPPQQPRQNQNNNNSSSGNTELDWQYDSIENHYDTDNHYGN